MWKFRFMFLTVNFMSFQLESKSPTKPYIIIIVYKEIAFDFDILTILRVFNVLKSLSELNFFWPKCQRQIYSRLNFNMSL